MKKLSRPRPSPERPDAAPLWRPRRQGMALAFGLALWGAVGCPATLAQQAGQGVQVAESTSAADLARARNLLEQAAELDARRHLPLSYQTVAEELAIAEQQGPGEITATERAETAASVATHAAQLLARIRYLQELRRQRQPLEAALLDFDRSLRQIALTARVSLDPELSGQDAASALVTALGGRYMQQQQQADSLRVALRKFDDMHGAERAAQESSLTALQVEVSNLRRQLWQTELRADLAEADRSAVTAALNARQEHEEAVQRLRQDFGQQEAEVLLTPDGDVILRVFGFNFAVGSAQLGAGQGDLLQKLAAAIARFPRSTLKIEGHTDDTGDRQSNLRLSRRRAESVSKALCEQIGLDPAAVQTVGYGPDRPLAPNSTTEGRARNRRIEVIIATGSE